MFSHTAFSFPSEKVFERPLRKVAVIHECICLQLSWQIRPLFPVYNTVKYSIGCCHILITTNTLFELVSGHTMKINNSTVQLQLGESLIRFYTEQSSESQGFGGKILHAMCQLGQHTICS